MHSRANFFLVLYLCGTRQTSLINIKRAKKRKKKMENNKIGYCAIILCLLFAVCTFLSFLYLYNECSKLKEEHVQLQSRTSEFLRADQIPAMIQTSEHLQHIRETQISQQRVMTQLEKRLNDLVNLGHRNQRLYDTLVQGTLQGTSTKSDPINIDSGTSSDEEDKKPLVVPQNLQNSVCETSASENTCGNACTTTTCPPKKKRVRIEDDIDKDEEKWANKLSRRAKQAYKSVNVN